MRRREFLKIAPIAVTARTKCLAQKPSWLEPEYQMPTTQKGREIAEIARSILISRDIEYVSRPERVLRLNVYLPGGLVNELLPAIVTFTHAAWRTENRSFRHDLDHLPLAPTPDLYAPVLVPRGFAVISADCRLASEAHFPAQIHDCKCAIRWTRANAERFHIDADRIGVMGSSASGQLAALAAVTGPEHGLDEGTCYQGYSSKVQAAYCFAALFDFERYEHEPGDSTLRAQIQDYLGGTYQQLPERYQQASPAHYVAPGDPPFLLMHGTEDRRVPYEQTVRFADALKQAGVPAKFVSVKNYAHSPIAGKEPDPSFDIVDAEIYRFFQEHLGAPRKPER